MFLFLAFIPLVLCLSHKCEPGLMGSLESTGGARVTTLSLLPPLRDWTPEIDDELFRDPWGVRDWFLFVRGNSNRVITNQGSPRISVLLRHQLEILDASPVG